MEEKRKDTYIWPELAVSNMEAAQQVKKTVYLYGDSGCGKTVFVKRYLLTRGSDDDRYVYLQAEELTSRRLEKIAGDREVTVLVLDDLQELSDMEEAEEIKARICRILTQGRLWVILISRGRMPGWLLEVQMEINIKVISEKELHLEDRQVRTYFENCGLMLNREDLRRIVAFTDGYGLMIRMFDIALGNFEFHRSGERIFLTPDRTEEIRNQLWEYLDEHVYSHWDLELLDFLMKLTIVEEFDLELAKKITGNQNAERMIAKALDHGTGIQRRVKEYSREQELMKVDYEIRPPVRRSLFWKLRKTYGEEEIQKLYRRAGEYYEQNDRIPMAFQLYEKAGDQERLKEFLIDHSRRNPAEGNYFELKQYYFQLQEETIRQNADLMVGMCMLKSLLMDFEGSEYWYKELEVYEKARSGEEKKYARSRLYYLDIVLPHRGSRQVADLMLKTATLLMDKKITIPEFSVTSNLPSIMNGGKDFCRWSKEDEKMAKTVGWAVSLVLGDYGKGLVNLALAESFLEKGRDNHEVTALVNQGMMQAEAGGRIELVFDGVAMLVRLYVLAGKLEEAMELLHNFHLRIEKEQAYRLLPNLHALEIRVRLYKGTFPEIQKWMKEEAPDEDQEFYTMDRYRYLLKVRIYLLEGRYERAVSLIEKLLYYAGLMDRTYIRMEASLLKAIAFYRMENENWKNVFCRVMTELEDYHFVRMVSREGAAVLPLLKSGVWKENDKDFLRDAMKETELMAALHPGYLKEQQSVIQLSENAIRILRLQAEGMSREDVAKELDMNLETVKYHIKQIYKKLGVKDKAAAVIQARKRNLI